MHELKPIIGVVITQPTEIDAAPRAEERIEHAHLVAVL
jgi:hypothetical protein